MASSSGRECPTDDVPYRFYLGAGYRRFGGNTHTLARVKQIIYAVVHQPVSVLQILLGSPKWYCVRDANHRSILEIAMLRNRRDVFGFLLSLKGFPLDLTNTEGETVLMKAIADQWDTSICYEYFASELLRRGATIHERYPGGETILNRAIVSNRNVAKMLINRGVDVNLRDSTGESPLCLAIYTHDPELVACLLCHGAIPEVTPQGYLPDFEYAVAKHCARHDSLVQRLVFWHSVDLFISPRINLRVLIDLATFDHRLLQAVVNCAQEITCSSNSVTTFYTDLFLLPNEPFRVIAQKCDFFQNFPVMSRDQVCRYIDCGEHTLENLSTLLESPARNNVVSYIQSLDCYTLFTTLFDLDRTESLWFYLSYGLSVDERCIQMVYYRYDTCSYFTILTHMRVTIEPDMPLQDRQLFPALYYDVHADVESPEHYTSKDLHRVLSHSAHPRLTRSVEDADLVERMPSVPLLVELARNCCRRMLVQRYKIENMNQLRILLHRLPVYPLLEQLILFEQHLYPLFDGEDDLYY